jgi:hypothetical protein
MKSHQLFHKQYNPLPNRIPLSQVLDMNALKAIPRIRFVIVPSIVHRTIAAKFMGHCASDKLPPVFEQIGKNVGKTF